MSKKIILSAQNSQFGRAVEPLPWTNFNLFLSTALPWNIVPMKTPSSPSPSQAAEPNVLLLSKDWLILHTSLKWDHITYSLSVSWVFSWEELKIHLFISCISYVYLSVWVPSICLVLAELRGGVLSFRTGVTSSYDLPQGFWELNLSIKGSSIEPSP